MRLYLDENVPVILARMLAEEGLDCTTARDAGNLSLSDDGHLAFATSAQRIMVTFDCKDFLALAACWQQAGRSHAGIILTKPHPIHELHRRFRHLLLTHRHQDFTNRIFWLPPVPLCPSKHSAFDLYSPRMVKMAASEAAASERPTRILCDTWRP